MIKKISAISAIFVLLFTLVANTVYGISKHDYDSEMRKCFENYDVECQNKVKNDIINEYSWAVGKDNCELLFQWIGLRVLEKLDNEKSNTPIDIAPEI